MRTGQPSLPLAPHRKAQKLGVGLKCYRANTGDDTTTNSNSNNNDKPPLPWP